MYIHTYIENNQNTIVLGEFPLFRYVPRQKIHERMYPRDSTSMIGHVCLLYACNGSLESVNTTTIKPQITVRLPQSDEY